MKGLKHNWVTGAIFIACLIFGFHMSFADDTCLFTTDGGPYTFTAPVVPVSRTTSSNRAYLAFFYPVEANFWAGNVVKLEISADGDIVDANGAIATWPNGAIKEDAAPFWATIDWADPTKSNYIHNSSRKLYTYLGAFTDLTDDTNEFKSSNAALTAPILGNPAQHTTAQIIDYIRGADVLDKDADDNTQENRDVITGDVLHSEPLVVQYNYPDNSSKTSKTMVYFGSNDGMLHAVLDTEIAPDGTEVDYGTEAWAFIPPDQLHKLKDIIEGDVRQYYVDSSPKAYFKDVNSNGVIDSGDGDKLVLICGERKGGTSYFALDITDPFAPVFLWRINKYEDTAVLNLPLAARPDGVIPELGESWSEPRFGLVKTSNGDDDAGTPVFFIGGGYSSDNSAGKAVLAINVFTGGVVKSFSNINGMTYSIPSSVTIVDGDGNGFVDKVYVGDLGGQMWRFGKFTDPGGYPLAFPDTDENIMTWSDQAAHIIFLSDPAHGRKFFYPPSVTLEWGYDLVFMGTGDREDPCNISSSDRIYSVKDTHASTTLTESDLIDVTDLPTTVPDIDVDQGWYIILAPGEKVLSEGVVFLKAYYVTTFLPGHGGALYALNYKTGEGVDGTLRVIGEGDGLLSKPVVVINKTDQKLLVSASRINPAAGESGSAGPGILAIEPSAPSANFFYLWWREL